MIDWAALSDSGFKGCVFDKDNTLTAPFQTKIHPRVRRGLQQCLETFKGNAVLYSNTAGLYQYDPEGKAPLSVTRAVILGKFRMNSVSNLMFLMVSGEEAAKLEGCLGLPVLRHHEKKPGGGSADLTNHFG